MSTAPSGPAVKQCCLCGADCSDRPRIKDAQGRYACRECAERARAKRAPAAPPPPVPSAPRPAASAHAGGFDMLDGLQQTDDGRLLGKDQKPCPSCARAMPADGVICVQCGYNVATGRAQRTRIVQEKAPKQARSRPSVGELPYGWIGLVFSILLAGAAFAFMDNNTALLAVMAIASAAALVGLIAAVVEAFASEETGWAIVGILTPFLGCTGLAMLYYVYVKSDSGLAKGLYLPAGVASAIAQILLQQNGFEF